MDTSNNSLKWMTFSGLAEDYPTWSTRFSAFAQTKGLYDTLTDKVQIPPRPTPLPDEPSPEQRAEHDRLTAARDTAIRDNEKNKNQIWCYLAMTLDANSLMLVRHDCVNDCGLGNGQKAWSLLQQKFRMDDRGDLEWFLGMRVTKHKDGITLDQETYIKQILETFGMQDCNPSKTPAENNLKLEIAKEDSARANQFEYRSLV